MAARISEQWPERLIPLPQWNKSQHQQQRQAEEVQSELENAKQALEQMQDYARILASSVPCMARSR